MQFTSSSLDGLVKKLFEVVFKHLVVNGFKFSELSGKLLKSVKQKFVYPCEYVNSFKRFFDDKLSGRCEFYISLKVQYISAKFYLHDVNVCSTFKMKIIGDYHDPYLKTTVA